MIIFCRQGRWGRPHPHLRLSPLDYYLCSANRVGAVVAAKAKAVKTRNRSSEPVVVAATALSNFTVNVVVLVLCNRGFVCDGLSNCLAGCHHHRRRCLVSRRSHHHPN